MSGKVIDLTGKKFNRLLVLELDHVHKKYGAFWKCKCDCGNEIITSAKTIKNGHSKSCGCYRHERVSETFFVDLIGKKFGRLLILELDSMDKVHGARWKCICDCGKEIIVRADSLKNGHTNSCGCYNKEKLHDSNFADISGERFGKLLVLGLDHMDKKRGAYWKCVCDCGNFKIFSSSSMQRGHTKSCGCYHKEKTSIEFGKASMNALYNSYKGGARNRNLEFNLSKEFFEKITQENCHYCGKEPSQIKKNYYNNGDHTYNGIDRIDNSKGYTEDNVVSCCSICNYAKKTATQSSFLEWIKKVYHHSIKDDFHDLDFLDF